MTSNISKNIQETWVRLAQEEYPGASSSALALLQIKATMNYIIDKDSKSKLNVLYKRYQIIRNLSQ